MQIGCRENLYQWVIEEYRDSSCSGRKKKTEPNSQFRIYIIIYFLVPPSEFDRDLSHTGLIIQRDDKYK